MGLRPTHRDENRTLRHPRASGGPRPDEPDSRFRGKDVTFDGAKRPVARRALRAAAPGISRYTTVDRTQKQVEQDSKESERDSSLRSE
jgi:hypothetical protein